MKTLNRALKTTTLCLIFALIDSTLAWFILNQVYPNFKITWTQCFFTMLILLMIGRSHKSVSELMDSYDSEQRRKEAAGDCKCIAVGPDGIQTWDADGNRIPYPRPKQPASTSSPSSVEP